MAVIYCDITYCKLKLFKFEEIITTARRAQEADQSCIQAYVLEAIALTELCKISKMEEGD